MVATALVEIHHHTKGFGVNNIEHCWTKRTHLEGDMYKHKTIVHITVMRGNKKKIIYLCYEVNEYGTIKMIVINGHGFVSLDGDWPDMFSVEDVLVDFPHISQQRALCGDVLQLYEYLCAVYKDEFHWDIKKCTLIISTPLAVDNAAFDYIKMLGIKSNIELEELEILW